MQITAQTRGLRIAPRKVRLVVGLVKKKDIDAALDHLAHVTNRSARWVAKTINSAVANAENNHRMVRSNLYIKNAWVDEGIKLRRWLPKGFGRAGEIQKKTSHINIVLDERVAGMRAQAAPAKKEETPAATQPEQEPSVQEAAGPEKKAPTVKRATEETKPTAGLKGFGKRLFRRKSI